MGDCSQQYYMVEGKEEKAIYVQASRQLQARVIPSLSSSSLDEQ